MKCLDCSFDEGTLLKEFEIKIIAGMSYQK
jgi:hypothetical protein